MYQAQVNALTSFDVAEWACEENRVRWSSGCVQKNCEQKPLVKSCGRFLSDNSSGRWALLWYW